VYDSVFILYLKLISALAVDVAAHIKVSQVEGDGVTPGLFYQDGAVNPSGVGGGIVV
jgi:hypothetical protein